MRRSGPVSSLLPVVLPAFLVLPAQAGPIRFQRVDEAWGIDFRHHDGASGRYYMVETNGGGVAVFDYDGDGDQDVFLVDGGRLPGYEGEAPRSRLLRNDGREPGGAMSFTDVTARAKLRVSGYGSGAAAGDVDGDGDLDLYVTAFGPNRLFVNRGDGTFSENGAAAGVDDPLWGSSAAFADVDRDGDLDLYVVNYVDFALDHNLACGDPRRKLRGYCGPDVYNGQPDRLFRNRGDGTFEDVTELAGFGAARGAGLALSFADFDGDGWIDLYVANDLTPNAFFRNLGAGPDGQVRFEDRSLISGTALGPRGLAEAGMGVAAADFDGDLRLDLAVTNYEGETHGLYSNRGSNVFSDQRFVSGLAEPTLRQLAFGVIAADLDHDGDLDLAVANGHVRENAAEFDPLSVYRQPNQVFENLGGGRFREVLEPGFSYAGASRGLAAGDLDGDGDLDLVVSNVNDQVEVYENLVVSGSGSWLQVDFRRSTGNRFAVGARVEVEAAGRRQVREVTAGSSYMSQSALTVHFGLGPARKVDRLSVRWPEGGVEVFEDLPVNRRLRLGG